MLIRSHKCFECVVMLSVILALLLPGVSYPATQPVVTILTPPITTNIGSPLRVAFNPDGDFFVSDPRMGGVSKFDSLGRLITQFKTRAPSQGLAVNDKGNLLVSQGDSVMILDQNGEELGRLGSGVGQFKKANGIAVDGAGYVYVVDSLDNSIKVFTAAGHFVRKIGSKGAGPGQFSMPTGIAYEKSANEIAVSDTLNGRVQFFSATGNFDYIKSIGSFGTKPLQFRAPVGITFEYGAEGGLNRMYVVDTYQNSVQVIDPLGNGTFLSFIGNNGFSNGQLMAPVDVVFDQANRRIVVANSSGHLSMYGIDGGTNPVEYTSRSLGIDPVPHQIGTDHISISGTVEQQAVVAVTTNTTAVAAPVVYTSSTAWKCSISGLVSGANELTVTAVNTNGSVAKHSIAVIYTP